MNKYFVLLLILFSTDLVAETITLEPDEAVVIAGVGRHDFNFAEMNTGETFKIKGGKKYKYKYFLVKAGNYYLKSIDTIFSDIDPLEYEKPKDTNLFFKIKSGTVTYIGEWIIDSRDNDRIAILFEITRDYSFKYLKKMHNRNKELSSLPLVVANEEGKSLSIDWEKVLQSSDM
ncbi:MAG: hypothetical protein AAF431_07645 [Pseudomonadota bacterium]